MCDQVETKLRALETLGVTKEKYTAMIYPLADSFLSDETFKAWECYRTAHRRANDDSLTVKKEVLSEETPLAKIMSKNDRDHILDFL